MTDPRDIETVERTIAAPASAIFDLLADPSRHPEIDGSGTIVERKPGSAGRVSLGSTFTMSMKFGVKYTMVSEVIELEENRRIAWQTRPTKTIGAKFGGGRIWRYELEPVENGTRVRESWDISQEKIRALVRPARKRTRASMEKTLARIEEIVTA
jgi:uncharacterized protein YndB with AHSA1/START domain